ncbi:DUF5123 domain-containing protein [Flavobacterium faecale]|uniref:DUF5123 domain-containing protein n=1 Tax=Flavobacterium faecale TaxID=1355330 RepID=UPI003AAB6DB2
MKTIYIFKGLLAAILLTFTVSSCDSYNVDLIDELLVDRVFAPTAIKAIRRNQTSVELSWAIREGVSKYVIEFSADDPDFTTIFKRVEVTAAELPVTIALEGETLYSIRVKAISATDLEDSKWSVTTVQTLSEQIFLASVPGDVKAKEATFRWPANSAVTKIEVTGPVSNPGPIVHVITAQEKANGIATVTGLTGETAYTAVLYNNLKKRGTATFTTGVDIGTGILVKPTDDLVQILANANSGDAFYLEPGDYTVASGPIQLTKSVIVRGLRSYDKPRLKTGFLINAGAANVSLIDLDLEGFGPSVDSNNDVVRFNEAGTFNSLLISGCNIRNFRKSFIAGDVTSSLVTTVTVENTIVSDVYCNGGDFIDFRKTNVINLDVKANTFRNCGSYAVTGERDFIRIDAAGLTGTGLTTRILLDSNTLYNVSNASGKRILYVRFISNASTVKNNLFAETVAIYSNQANTADPVFTNNNYFNATGFHSTATKFDNSGTFTTLNPGFTDAAAGNFKISNQTLKDNKVGDPRWRL